MAQSLLTSSTPLRSSSRSFFSSLPHLFFSSNSPRSSSFRTHSLRPPGPLLEEDSSSSSAAESPSQKSRNDLKREARRAVKWGMDLASFSTPQIKRIIRAAALETEVLEALMLVKRLGPDVREGKRRQFNYIGRLLRSAQPELLDALIQASKDGDNSKLISLSGLETSSTEDDDEEEDAMSEKEGDDHIELIDKWFDGLVDNDPLITKEVYSLYNVEFDRQELRRLVRQVQSIQGGRLPEETGPESDSKLTIAKKPLVRFLRSLAKQALAE